MAISPAHSTTPFLAYSIEQAADALGLSRAALCRLLANGTLRSVKIGRRRIVPASALHALVEGEPRGAA